MNRLAGWLVVSTLFVCGTAAVGCGKYGPPERTLPPEILEGEPGYVPPAPGEPGYVPPAPGDPNATPPEASLEDEAPLSDEVPVEDEAPLSDEAPVESEETSP